MNKMELRVIKGLGVIRSIEHTDVNEDNCPAVDIIVIDCGEIPDGEDFGITNFFKDGDLYPDWPSDLDAKIDDLSWWITAVEGIKALGNEMFKKQDYKMALRKYRKAMRYLDFCWDLENLDTEKKHVLEEDEVSAIDKFCCKISINLSYINANTF
ncbi:hypothetical protein Droror1_Dr00013745 [Drosera rotundifolia]